MTRRSYLNGNLKIAVTMGVFTWSVIFSACMESQSATNLPAIPALFLESSLEIKPETTIDPTIIRSRYVNLNFNLLDESEVNNKILLNLFDDVVYTAILEKKESNLTGGYTWSGHLDGIEHSQVIVIVGGDQVAGNISLPGAFYEVRYTNQGVHLVTQIDQSAYPQEAEPVEPGS